MKVGKKNAHKKKYQKGQLVAPWALAIHVIATIGVLVLCSTVYFYLILPSITNHEKYVTIPDLTGLSVDELDQFLKGYQLRYQISDSSYSRSAPALTVLKQFPRAEKQVKINRRIYITINQTTPPTVLLPDIVDQSRINAGALLHSSDLQVGQIIWEPSPFFNLIKELRYMGKAIAPGTPVPKGSAIDLVVGDGQGNATFRIQSLIGASYEQVLAKLGEWNLNIGNVEIPVNIDTTNVFPVVYRQYPEENEWVHVGDPVNIWLAPAGYEPPPADEEME